MLLLLLAACHLASVPSPPGDSPGPDTGPTDDTSWPDDTAPPDDTSGPDDTAVAPLDGFTLTLDADIVTLIHATWDDPGTSRAWVEYRFSGGPWREAPSIATGTAVILGVPAETEVEARARATAGGDSWISETATITTGVLPRSLLAPTISSYREELAYDADYAMIVVSSGSYTYAPPYWIEILDRSGRIVWYHRIPEDMMGFYPTVARDGTHIWFEAENIFGMGSGRPSVTRRTLDGHWSVTLPVPSLGEAIAEGPDGSFYFETRKGSTIELSRLDPDGSISQEWDCSAWFRAHRLYPEYCAMNTCNWDETRNTVLVSQFYTDTVFEIDLDTGQPVRQMGQLTVGDPWTFAPVDSMFAYQHNPYWTDTGTLLVSTHVVGRHGVQVAAEYELDDTTQTIRRVWAYQSTDMWATQVGEAIRLPNGNTTQGYGQDGAVREVTPDGTVVWQAVWPRDGSGYRVVGHLSLLPDLYALNRGP